MDLEEEEPPARPQIDRRWRFLSGSAWIESTGFFPDGSCSVSSGAAGFPHWRRRSSIPGG